MTFNLAWTFAQFLSRLFLIVTCILNIFGIVSMNLMGIMWSEDVIERSVCHFLCYFCTQLTFDLVLRPRVIFSVHHYRFFYTYRNIISLDAGFYPILSSDVFFFFMKWTANYQIQEEISKLQ